MVLGDSSTKSKREAEKLLDNRASWDHRVDLHVGSKFYDLDSFRNGKCSLNSIEVAGVGDVTGKSLLHLQCHFGQDTLSWARRGARVTGVDLSPRAIQLARGLAEELSIESRFVESNVLDLKLEETFDIVFTSYGVLGWLPDLGEWARVVASALAPGGFLYLVEFHPTLLLFDFDTQQLGYEYFHQAYTETTSGTYADKDDQTTRTEHFWSHPLESIIGSLLKQGLVLEEFREFDYSPYDCFPNMSEVQPGRYRFETSVTLPHIFSLKAAKAAK
jgi:SAM-dependent methyltransferase